MKIINGIPILNKEEYTLFISENTREECVNILSNIFMNKRDKPLDFISDFDDNLVSKKLNSLYSSTPRWINDEPVVMKHSYDFDIKSCLGITQLGHSYNIISDSFQKEQRMACGGYNRVSPITVWNGGNLSDDAWREVLKGFLSPLFRNVNTSKRIGIQEYKFCFRLSSSVYSAAQFKVHVAKQIIEKYSMSGRVLDFSSGWGDRLAGFFASTNATEYYGTDPNVNLHKGYKSQMDFYNKVLGKNLKVEIDTLPAEEKKWNSKVDLVFTSPPYYYTEKYAEGSACEDRQSWKRYNTYEEWKNNFLFKTFDNFNDVVEKDGILAINIFDINIRKEKYEVVKDFIDYSTKNGYEYLGFVGMRMKQRPKNFSNVSHKDEYMSANYVEPIWILKKL